MPAQLVAAAVAVRSNARTQPLHLDDQLFARERLKILVHESSTSAAMRMLGP